MSDASFDWFWRPPQEGQPGLMMIRDTHPGPHAPDVKFVTEDLKGVLHYCESRLPTDIHLPALRIFVCDMLGLWLQVQTNVLSRHFTTGDPELSDQDLNTLWEAREGAPGGGVA